MVSTKDKILQWKEEIDALKQGDCKDLLEKKDRISRAIKKLFQRLQKQDYEGDEEYNQINIQMNTLSDMSKRVEKKYRKRMKKEFRELHDDYSNIWQMFVDTEVDERTLCHVLNAFDRLEKGSSNKEQEMKGGLQFMTERYNLPSDFFKQ